MPLFQPQGTTILRSKHLPVLLLLDESSSMSTCDGSSSTSRIAALNHAVQNMVKEFSALCRQGQNICVGIISFNSEAHVHRPDGVNFFAPADKIQWTPLSAGGYTAMGAALENAMTLLENELPKPCYRPLVVLLSDGEPNDEWRGPLQRFITQGNSARCERLALMVGQLTVPEALRLFTQGCQNPVVRAENSGEISRFFQFVTMSVSTRSHAANHNQPQRPPTISLEDFMKSTVSAPDTSFGDFDSLD